MPTLEEKQTATAEGIVLSVAQLRARIEQRRQGAWLPDPGDTEVAGFVCTGFAAG